MQTRLLMLSNFTVVSIISAVFFTSFGMIHGGFWGAMVASILLLLVVKGLIGNYSNLLFLFCVFFIMYGLSGPANVLYGEGLPSIFSQPYATGPFLLHYLLAIFGLFIGFFFTSFFTTFIPNTKLNNMDSSFVNEDIKLLYMLGLVFGVLASGSELLNFFRAGGLSTLGQGKAVYQSVTSALSFTLPSYGIANLSVALFGVATALKEKRIGFSLSSRIMWYVNYFAIISPLILITTVLGQRGELLALMMILVVGLTYLTPLKKVSIRLILILLIIYIFMSFLFANRANLTYAISSGDWEHFSTNAFQVNKLVSALNPGSNEFGAAFGNFSEYYFSDGYKDFKLGETYLSGLTVVIPSWAYLGEKPQNITYKFRDQFFPQERERGSIAGTGFSSILEAYMNFGTLGVILMYTLFGMLLLVIETMRQSITSIYFAVFYLQLIPISQTFHRSSMGFPIFFPLLFTIFFCIVYTLLHGSIYSQHSEKHHIHFARTEH